MEVVPEALLYNHLHLLTRFIPPYRFLSPYHHHHHHNVLSCRNACNFTLYMPSSISTKQHHHPLTKFNKGDSFFANLLLWVVWTLQADLPAAHLLYITGDSTVLGCWEPGRAVKMSPIEHSNLWIAQLKVTPGVNIKYNYFIKENSSSSSDIIWRPGPQVSLSVPLSADKDKEIIVNDSWILLEPQKFPAHIWGSWIEDSFLSFQPFTTLTKGIVSFISSLLQIVSLYSKLFSEHSNASSGLTDNVEIGMELNNDDKGSKPFLNDLRIKNKTQSDVEVTVSATDDLSVYFSERDQPVEEPWLLGSCLVSIMSKNDMEVDILEKSDEGSQLENTNLNSQATDELLKNEASLSLNEDSSSTMILMEESDKLLPNEASLSLNEDSVSTMILINSSICTMQRIAVLEDEKLVELLLEPVKNNVQCDSMYIGVVTKLVPHMGGAFVNIGSSRHSLMDIKQNREPFVFSPFRWKSKKQAVNGSVSGVHEEHHNNQEPDVDNDFDITEILMDNLNDNCEHEADSDDELDGEENHLEGQTATDLEISDNSEDAVQSTQLRSLGNENKWEQVRKGTKVIVQVVKEGLGSKSPTLTAYPKLKSRFWVLLTRCDRVGVSKKICGVERTRLKVIAKSLQPQGFGVTVRTVAAGHSLEELQKDLEGLLTTWKNIVEHAKSAALAADEGIEGACPVLLHRAMGQTLSVVQDYFNDKVKKMVVDSPRTYHEVTNYLQEIAPNLCDRVELYDKRTPLFDEFNVEEEIDNMLSKRVPLPNGGSLVIEQTEALVSIDVNGGHGMFGQGNSPEKANLEVNLAAAKQIAREIRLRDIGGIIVVDFIDMIDESNKRLVYEEVKKAVERDRSMVKVSELSRHGLMEITRKRVRPSVTFMISEPCSCCHATGRVEALENSYSKIEQEICRLLANMDQEHPENPKSWPRFILRVDNHMCEYLTSGKRTRLAILSSSLKVARGFIRGEFEVKPFTDDMGNKNQQHQVAISMLRRAEARGSGPAKNKSSGKSITLVPVKKYKGSKK
ncbi:hypothetical protein ACFE04_003175 [Oxalis oulophora]